MKYRANRRACDRQIALHANGEVAHVTLRDISSTGARFEGATALPRGAQVTLNLLSGPTRGCVVWFRGGLTGVKFDQPLTAAQLTLVLQPASQRHPSGSSHRFRELR